MVLGQQGIHRPDNQLGLLLHTTNQLKMHVTYALNITTKTMTISEVNIGVNL